MDSYTVFIRTLGKAGKKYQETVDSILRQTIQPDKIVVVLPEGYNLPEYITGRENFMFSRKGMVAQRNFGFEICNTPYVLSIDDDLSFDETFVENLFSTMRHENADFVSPRVIYTEDVNYKLQPVETTKKSKNSTYTVKNLMKYMMGVSWNFWRNDDFILRVSKTGGFICNPRNSDPLPNRCQSGHGTIIFGKTELCRNVNFDAETWCEAPGYALMEDQIFYYKEYLNGAVIVYDPSILLLHLDANTSIDKDKKITNIYASGRNTVVFWHRFIYKVNPSINAIISLSRRLFFTLAVSFISGLFRFNLKKFKTYLRAYGDGLKFVLSKEYKKLPSVLIVEQNNK